MISISFFQNICMQLISNHELYDIETELLYETCFVHNSTQKASQEELQVRIVTICCIDASFLYFNVKTRFPIFQKKCMRPWIRRYLIFLDLCPRRETKLGSLIYDIGTTILYGTCFVHNSTQKASPEELQVRIGTKLKFVTIRT